MVTASSPTLLELTGVGVNPYSARGLTQTLQPIGQATSQRRTVNGTLIDLGFDGFQKYQTTISGNDQAPPVSDGIWPGKLVTVKCIAELCYPTGAAGAPHKTAVAGSSRVEGDFTYYRPELAMMIVNAPQMSYDEWGAQIGWSMLLEEV
jgi:hypothetical protein